MDGNRKLTLQEAWDTFVSQNPSDCIKYFRVNPKRRKHFNQSEILTKVFFFFLSWEIFWEETTTWPFPLCSFHILLTLWCTLGIQKCGTSADFTTTPLRMQPAATTDVCRVRARRTFSLFCPPTCKHTSASVKSWRASSSSQLTFHQCNFLVCSFVAHVTQKHWNQNKNPTAKTISTESVEAGEAVSVCVERFRAGDHLWAWKVEQLIAACSGSLWASSSSSARQQSKPWTVLLGQYVARELFWTQLGYSLPLKFLKLNPEGWRFQEVSRPRSRLAFHWRRSPVLRVETYWTDLFVKEKQK